MYSSFPSPTLVNISGQGNMINMDVNFPIHTVPEKCLNFLQKLGWEVATSHPDTKESLFQKNPPKGSSDEIKKEWNYDLQHCYWHWYEAMAYEFGKFMGIDEDTGGGIGNTEGAQAASAPAGVQNVGQGGREA